MTPDDYEALLGESRDEPAFSNSDEGYGFMSANCDQCIHDRGARIEASIAAAEISEGDAGDHDPRGCPLVLITLIGRRPAQFLDGPRNKEGHYSRAHQYVCTEYRHEDDGPPDPQPIPDPPGQDGLFPREQVAGVRMLTALPEREEVTA